VVARRVKDQVMSAISFLRFWGPRSRLQPAVNAGSIPGGKQLRYDCRSGEACDVREEQSIDWDGEMSDAKVRGVVHVIEETTTYGAKGFRKRLVVLEQDNGRFTNYVPVEFTQDKCDSVNDLKIGDDVEIAYRLNGRKWQKDPSSEVKFFLNAEGLNFTVHSGGGGSANAGAANDEFAEASYDEDDIPF